MKVLSNGKVRRSREERAELVSKYRSSGLSLQSFCEQEGIPISSLRNWLLPKRSSKRTRDSSRDTGKRNSGAFVEVEARSAEPIWDIELELKSGTVLRLRG